MSDIRAAAMSFAHQSNENLNHAQHVVETRLGTIPETAIILGSGLGLLAAQLTHPQFLATTEIPGYVASTVAGHKGRWGVGSLGTIPVLLMQGRVHAYEGYALSDIIYPIHLMAALGVKNLIVTNAAGAINRHFSPGQFMCIVDQLNLTFKSPLRGLSGQGHIDMRSPFDQEFGCALMDEARALGIKLPEGVYAGLFGPCYETAAEIRMLQRLGADAVGMSTIPEVIAATAHGLRLVGLSLLSNMATGLSSTKLMHDDVTQMARRSEDTFAALATALLGRISR